MTLCEEDGGDHLRDGQYQWWGPLHKKRVTNIGPNDSWDHRRWVRHDYIVEKTSYHSFGRGMQSWNSPMRHEWTNVFTRDCYARLNVACPPKYEYTVCAMTCVIGCTVFFFYFAPLWVKQCCNWRNWLAKDVYQMNGGKDQNIQRAWSYDPAAVFPSAVAILSMIESGLQSWKSLWCVFCTKYCEILRNTKNTTLWC